MTEFHLIRRLDGLIYDFVPDPSRTRLYRRVDRPDLTITYEDRLGWVMRDPVSGTLVGRVWDMDVAAQSATPPATVWVTAKGDKSYIYDLHHGAREEGSCNA